MGLVQERQTNLKSSIKGKADKSKTKYEKLAKFTSFKEGLGYESGLALVSAVKVEKNVTI